MAQGSAGLGWRRRGAAITRGFRGVGTGCSSGMCYSAAFSSAACAASLPASLGSLPLDVPAKAEAHGRKQLFSESVLLARAESGVDAHDSTSAGTALLMMIGPASRASSAARPAGPPACQSRDWRAGLAAG